MPQNKSLSSPTWPLSRPPCKCHVKAYIFKSSVPQNEERFASENLSENKF